MDELSLNEYIAYAWENLFFMRPDWLYAFIPIGLILFLFILTYRRNEEWKKGFSKELLPYLTIKGTKRQFVIPKLLLIFLLSLMTLAMAGPTWEQIDRPGQKTEAALVVLMDLSYSMLAEDIQPNRIERAKLKLKDFFDAKPNSRVALIAYAGTAHNVVPFSKDYKTIIRQMDALRPGIMPVAGSNLGEAMDMADSLLTKIVAPSTVLLVTDNIRAEEVQRIAQTAVNTHVEVMAIATPTGGTIPTGRGDLKDKEGNTVIARLDVINLDQLQELDNVNVITVTLDNSDVQILAARVRQNLEFIVDLENVEEEWKDFGYWLVFPIMLLGLFWFRRGWKVHWMWLLFLFCSCNEAGEFNLKDQFFTPDQRGQILADKGEKQKAAETYESGNRKGYAYYEMGDLEKAAEAYSSDMSPEGLYNLGVVYAEMGDLEAARQAFAAAYELDPELEKANQNFERVTQVMDSVALAQGLPVANSEKANNTPDQLQDYQEQGDDRDQALDSEEEYEGEGDIQEMVSKEVDENTIDIFEFDENVVMDKEAAKQTLLRQVTEDPSLFLRRKFAYQNRRRAASIKSPEEIW